MVEKITLKDIQERVNIWIQVHGGYWPSLSMICAVMEELGELAREINSIEGYKPKKVKNYPSKIGVELGDLLFSIICIANHYEVDLGEEIIKVIEKYSSRDSSRFL
ncbi:MAG: MazG nucleotide pyrophosphohydrolase domain-containing protein [Promethearchaeota archaeon]